MASQHDQISDLKTTTLIQHQNLMDLNNSVTQRIIDTLSERLERPSCPPVLKQQACANGATDPRAVGRADRLRGKVIVGELEKFYLVGPGYVYDARIDSGANTSSLDARNVKRFERDGKNWVRFEVPVPKSADKLTTLEREIVRNVRIIQSNEEGYERRAVVELQFAIGNHKQKAEFTLSEREQMTYPVLIGRNILRDVMLIDVGKEYATELPDSLIEASKDSDN
ncbi:ATP-dependent zinc protease family protein [Marinobacter caseinilyticus]|uniref:ATP-dependent zinc protease family protein n=1 Tax=Marinobacter caseinilyticus TaxID=2692195 RepID=UPI001F1EA41A|nr:ATP-dependent zinc protease [Marinobacter caseinilyticus]